MGRAKQKRTQKKLKNIKRTKSIQDVINNSNFTPKSSKPLQLTKLIQKKPVNHTKKIIPALPKKGVEKKKQNIKKQISNSSFKNQKFSEKEIPKYINMEQLKEGIHEMDEHFNFKEKFLGKEGAFSTYKILIGCFLPMEDEVHGQAGKELKKRGFSYDLTSNISDFSKQVNDYDIAWILSSSNRNQNNKVKETFLKSIEKFMKAKKSLFLWSDNDPLYVETNWILEKFFNGMKMTGNYYGYKQVTRSETDELTKGTFDRNHSIGYGVNNLHEGDTICHPINVHPDFKHFAFNTEGNPLVSYADENEHHGRILLDCGFTKLDEEYWTNAGTHQYISNANVWLTGIPM